MNFLCDDDRTMKYRCILCCKDSDTDPCQHCGNKYALYIKGEKHDCHWSRRTISTMECKICDRVISNDDYFSGNIKDL